MLTSAVCIVLGLAAAAYAVPLDTNTCANGFMFVNGETDAVMYDDRDIKTCDERGSHSCIRISYMYKTPEALVKAQWDMPCFDPKKLPSFNLNTLFPAAALPLAINLKVCIPEEKDECVDFTPAADINLFCNAGVVVVDTSNSNAPVTLLDDTKKMQCKAHSTGCFTMTQHFMHKGQTAMHMSGGCYDEWRSYSFIWDKFYPYTDFTGGFCESQGCITFKVWHKDSFDTRTCYCENKKIPGYYGTPVVESCTGSMCNDM